MSFVSSVFILFLLSLFLVYYLSPQKWRWGILLAASLIFYASVGVKFLLYILVLTLAAFLTTSRIFKLQVKQKSYLDANKTRLSRAEKTAYRQNNKKRQKGWLWLALLLTIGILALIKYTNFTISNINIWLTLFKTGKQISFVNIALPLGLSFYTFQTVGYILDVYRGKQEPVRNVFKLALFVSFFPQMIQGPISRYSDLSVTLYSGAAFDRDQFARACQRILWGFFKKIVIADRVAVAVNQIFQTPADYRGVYVFIGMLMYALQLYADFTGGIDISIGIAQALGIKLQENFRQPFFAKNTADYWRRWHMTMGSWFRDYLFYPLSVSRPLLKFSNFTRKRFGKSLGKRIPVYLATIIVWFTTGLWHGASWNFVVWGLLNGLVIIVSQELTPLYRKFHGRFNFAGKHFYEFWQIVRTFLIMSSIRLLDCYRDVKITFQQYFSIFTYNNFKVLSDGSLVKLGLSIGDYLVLLVGIVLMIAVSLVQKDKDVYAFFTKESLPLKYLLFASLLLVIIVFGAYGIGFDAGQFIYNQF